MDGISDLCAQPGKMALLCAFVCTSKVCEIQRDSERKVETELVMFLLRLSEYIGL